MRRKEGGSLVDKHIIQIDEIGNNLMGGIYTFTVSYQALLEHILHVLLES